jgi:hypothetical protein
MARGSRELQLKRSEIRLQSAPFRSATRTQLPHERLSEALNDLQLTGGVQIPLVRRRHAIPVYGAAGQGSPLRKL